MTRLRDMGIEPFLISSSLLGVLAQRLVRTLCPDCKEPYEADKEQRKLFDSKKKEPLILYRATGCLNVTTKVTVAEPVSTSCCWWMMRCRS